MVLAHAEHVDPDRVRQLDLLDELAEPLLRSDLASARVREGEDADLHPRVLPARRR